jgi:hypothetical protein
LFKNRVLRKMFKRKRDEVSGECRRIHNEELRGLYPSPNIIRVIKLKRMRWAGYVARVGDWRGAYRVLVGKTDEKKPLRRPRRRRKVNIKMVVQEMRWRRGLD